MSVAKRRPSGDGMVRKTPSGRWEGRIVVGHKENGDPIFRYVYGKTQKELLEKDEVWRDFFYTELTTGLRCGEICGLQRQDFDEEKGTLKINRTLHCPRIGEYTTGETKTGKGTRRIVLPPSTADRLRKRKAAALTEWIFPNPAKPELPTAPQSAYHHMKTMLKNAGLPSIRFHDLRHTFATTALGNGMDVKTLSAMLGHVSAATTLDIYTHTTDAMQAAAAASIDRGIGKADSVAPEQDATQAEKPAFQPFVPYRRKTRKPGTGCISQISEHCWEGRYSPMWPDGKKHSRNVYAKTREECEALLPGLIAEMKAEIQAIKKSGDLDAIPDGVSKKKKQIAAYM